MTARCTRLGEQERCRNRILFILTVFGSCQWTARAGRTQAIRLAAALGRGTLADDYPRLFRIWFALAAVILVTMVAIILLMVWQPRLD